MKRELSWGNKVSQGGEMKRLILMSLMLLAFAAPAYAQVIDAPPDNEAVCPAWDFKYDYPAEPEVYEDTYTAPDGYAIVELCVKAGSIEQGDGPVFTTFDPPVTSVTFTHPSEKGLSHFSVRLVEVTDETTTTTTTTTEPPEETTTTVIEETTTTTEAEETTTTTTEAATTTTAGATTTDTLPLTGIEADDLLPVALGLTLAGAAMLGGTAAWSARATTREGRH